MADSGAQAAQTRTSTENKDTEKSHTWLDVLKVVLMPVVGLAVGALFNSSLNARQSQENNLRLYTEMMGKREEADSALRKDMFNSMLSTFMPKDQKPALHTPDKLRQDVLSLELLAYNFHESLDLGPLFKDVRRRIPAKQDPFNADLRTRLETVAQEVIERQLTTLADSGTIMRGNGSWKQVNRLNEFTVFDFGGVVADEKSDSYQLPEVLCLSTAPVDLSIDSSSATRPMRNYRRFTLELIGRDPKWGIRVRLYVSKHLSKDECMATFKDESQRAAKLADEAEVDTIFWVDQFDFPLIDNTRLSHDERCAVALSQLVNEGETGTVNIALAYFPGARASLKEKPYYDEIMKSLVRRGQTQPQ